MDIAPIIHRILEGTASTALGRFTVDGLRMHPRTAERVRDFLFGGLPEEVYDVADVFEYDDPASYLTALDGTIDALTDEDSSDRSKESVVVNAFRHHGYEVRNTGVHEMYPFYYFWQNDVEGVEAESLDVLSGDFWRFDVGGEITYLWNVSDNELLTRRTDAKLFSGLDVSDWWDFVRGVWGVVWNDLGASENIRMTESPKGRLTFVRDSNLSADRDYFGDSRIYLDLWDRIAEAKDTMHTVMLHGPPGTGKTTLALEAAFRGDNDVAEVYPEVVASWNLPSLLKKPAPDVVLVNDLDRLEPQKMQALVRSLDDPVEYVDLMLMTCNDLTEFPEAVRRPGRIDQIVHIGRGDVDAGGLADRIQDEYDFRLTDEQTEAYVDAVETHGGAHAVELARRFDALGADAVPYNDVTFDEEFLDELAD